MIPVVSDWVGIIGLIIGTFGLLITFRTFWKVRTVQSAIEEMKTKHLFQVRLPDHLKELSTLRGFVLRSWRSNKTVDVIQDISRVKSICENIQKHSDQEHLKNLQPLFDFTLRIQERERHLVSGGEVEDFYKKLTNLINEIQQFLQDQEMAIR